jgi:hypothetical protein
MELDVIVEVMLALQLELLLQFMVLLLLFLRPALLLAATTRQQLECKISLFLDKQDANGTSTLHTMAAIVVLKVSRAHNLIILLLATSFVRIESIRPIYNCNTSSN